MFVVRAGSTESQAATQAALFAVDGLVIVYLSLMVTRARRRAETSEARQRNLIELAPDAFFLADLDGRFTDVNQSTCGMLGYGCEELIGKTIADIIPPDDVPRLAAVRAALVVPGQVERGEWRLRRKDGTLIPVDVSANNLPGGRWQAFARDISEARRGAREREELLAREQLARRQAETASQKLRESEERFRLTIDEAPIGMALVDLDGRFARVNAALCEIVGYTAHELERLRFQDITHPEDLDSDLALVGRLIRGEIPRYQLEKRYIRKDGSVVTILLSTSMLRGLDGAPLYFIAQIEDITERKRAGETLRESERRLHLALESAQMGTWDLDLLTDTSVRSLRHDQIFGYASAIPTWGAARFHESCGSRGSRCCATSIREKRPRPTIRYGMPNTLAGRVHSLDLGQGSRLSEPKGRAGENDGHRRGHQRAQARGGGAAEERTGVSVVGRVHAADRLGHPAGWVEHLLQSAMGDYTGLTLEESYGEGWITPFHPDDRQRAWDAWQRATQYRDTYSLECRLRRADGVYRWWLVRGVPLLGANGEIIKWFGTCTDIEQIKIAEQRLKESEAKFSGIISISADAIISIDEEQRITIFNKGAEQIFGYSQAEAIGDSARHSDTRAVSRDSSSSTSRGLRPVM